MVFFAISFIVVIVIIFIKISKKGLKTNQVLTDVIALAQEYEIRCNEHYEIKKSELYTSIQKKEFENKYAQFKKEINIKCISLVGQFAEGTFQVLEVDYNENRKKWEIRFCKNVPSPLKYLYVFLTINKKDLDNLSEAVFKLRKGDKISAGFYVKNFKDGLIQAELKYIN